MIQKHKENWSWFSQSLPHPPFQFIHGDRLVERYILLGPVHPLQSGGSGPVGHWPGHSAGPVAGAVVSHWRVVACSSGSLWENRRLSINPGDKRRYTHLGCLLFPNPKPKLPQKREILHSEIQVNVPQQRTWHFIELIGN